MLKKQKQVHFNRYYSSLCSFVTFHKGNAMSCIQQDTFLKIFNHSRSISNPTPPWLSSSSPLDHHLPLTLSSDHSGSLQLGHAPSPCAHSAVISLIGFRSAHPPRLLHPNKDAGQKLPPGELVSRWSLTSSGAPLTLRLVSRPCSWEAQAPLSSSLPAWL